MVTRVSDEVWFSYFNSLIIHPVCLSPNNFAKTIIFASGRTVYSKEISNKIYHAKFGRQIACNYSSLSISSPLGNFCQTECFTGDSKIVSSQQYTLYALQKFAYQALFSISVAKGIQKQKVMQDLAGGGGGRCITRDIRMVYSQVSQILVFMDL